VHFFSHAQGGTQHDEPNKEKPAHFLGPHVPGNEIGVSGKDLHTHGYQQKQDRENQKIRQQRIDKEQQLFHEQLLGSADKAVTQGSPPQMCITSMH
jgi:hypothetical protein